MNDNTEIEKKLDIIREKLYDETKNMTFKQKKNREKKMISNLADEGFNFKYLSEKVETSYNLSQEILVINEEILEYEKKEED